MAENPVNPVRAVRSAAGRISHESPGIITLPALAAMHPYVAPPPEGIGLLDCWLTIRRHLRLIVGLLIAVLLMTGLIAICMTPNFTASSTLLIEAATPQVLDIKELLDDHTGSQDYDYYKTQFALLKSRDLAAGVIRDLDLMHTSPFTTDMQPG